MFDAFISFIGIVDCGKFESISTSYQFMIICWNLFYLK